MFFSKKHIFVVRSGGGTSTVSAKHAITGADASRSIRNTRSQFLLIGNCSLSICCSTEPFLSTDVVFLGVPVPETFTCHRTTLRIRCLASFSLQIGPWCSSGGRNVQWAIARIRGTYLISGIRTGEQGNRGVWLCTRPPVHQNKGCVIVLRLPNIPNHTPPVFRFLLWRTNMLRNCFGSRARASFRPTLFMPVFCWFPSQSDG